MVDEDGRKDNEPDDDDFEKIEDEGAGASDEAGDLFSRDEQIARVDEEIEEPGETDDDPAAAEAPHFYEDDEEEEPGEFDSRNDDNQDDDLGSYIPDPPSVEPRLPDILLSDSSPREVGEPELTDEESGRRFSYLGREDTEDEIEETHGLHPRTLVIVGGVVVSFVFAVLLGYLYLKGGEPASDADVMVVEAPEGPAKVEPEDRGGLDVPDQDKQVFDRVTGEESGLEEKLADGPEEPQPLPPGDEPGDESKAEPSTTAPVEQSPAAVAPSATEPEPEPVETPPVPVTSGAFLVQLGSFASQLSAETGWTNLSGRHGAILAGLSSDIQRADLGARGIFYRLRAGPFESRAEASGACRALKAVGRDCLVVAR